MVVFSLFPNFSHLVPMTPGVTPGHALSSDRDTRADPHWGRNRTMERGGYGDRNAETNRYSEIRATFILVSIASIGIVFIRVAAGATKASIHIASDFIIPLRSHIKMSQFSPQVLDTLRQTVDAACADPKTGIPGSSVVVVGRNGKELFAHCAGKRGVDSKEAMTLDNVYWIASCTKMIVGIACMQLVENGTLSLDDSNQLETLCPELKAVKVLQNDGTLVEKNTSITLRMLLTHTGV